jgi:hypothetical protein
MYKIRIDTANDFCKPCAMADEIQEQAQAASEQSPTATEQTVTPPAAVDANATLTTLAPDKELDGMDATAYAELLRDLATTPAPEAEAPAPVEAVPAEQPTTEEEGKAHKEPEAPEILPERIRTSQFSEREKMVLKVHRDMREAGTPISLAEAESRVNALYGGEPAAKGEEAAPADPTPEPSDIAAQIADLKAAKKAAARDVDLEKVLEIDEQIEGLREQLTAAERAAAARQAETTSKFDQKKAELRAMFPDFNDANSALSQKWAELHDEYATHPIMNDPVEAAEFLAYKAASALKVPIVQNAKAAPSIPADPRRVPVQPASGPSPFGTMTQNQNPSLTECPLP